MSGKRYTDEFKATAIRQVNDRGHSVSDARVHSSFIRASAGSAVYTQLEAADGHYLDFRHNYWWTTESDSIQARIYDGLDPKDRPSHPQDRVVVDFEPFLLTPVATEKGSVGSLKARFRQQE